MTAAARVEVVLSSLTAAILLATGCGGQVANSVDASATADGRSDARTTTDGASGADVNSDSALAHGDAEVSGEVGAEADAAGCSPLRADLDASADAGSSTLTLADVTCMTTADCVVYACSRCGCFISIIGMSDTSTFECYPPPCAPPFPPCATMGYVTQDCKEVADESDVGVACIDHQCLTFAK